MRARLITSLLLWAFVSSPAFAESDAFILQRLLQRYTEAYGGTLDANSLKSISIEGTIEQDGQVFEFLMRKKRPNTMRYRMSLNDRSVTFIFNGANAWLRTVDGESVEISDLDPTDTELLREARFESPLFRAQEKRENQIELLDSEALGEKNTYLLKVTERDDSITHYYLDGSVTQIIRRDQINAEGEIAYQTLYRDFKEVEGFSFAHEIENLVDGERVSLAKIQKIVVNPGLLNFYFEKPTR